MFPTSGGKPAPALTSYVNTPSKLEDEEDEDDPFLQLE